MTAELHAPIQQEALELLEWPRLAQHVSSFASTAAGRAVAARLPLASTRQQSVGWLAETTELLALDGLVEGGLSFQGAADLDHTLQLCAKGGVASGDDLLAVATTLAAARRLRRQIDDPELRPVTTALVEPLRTLPELEQRLRFCIEDGGRVADRASPPLSGLRRQLASVRMERRDRLNELIRRYAALLQDTVVAERNGRPVLAVKAGAGSQLPGLVHDSSASGNTVFIEPQAVIPLGNRIRQLEGEEREAERAVLQDLSGLVGEEQPALEHLQQVLIQLDLALARARYGAWLGAVRPELEADPLAPLQLEGLRHPLLLWQERRQGGQAVVPVSVRVESSLRVVAITGPNTGGKTVTLKSVGLAVLMARAGLFVPCKGSPRLPWCQQVLADIGDEQSIARNLSTFSAHLENLRGLVTTADERSLVLIDEMGTGTDPAEGAALSRAVLEELVERGATTIVSSHLGELKQLDADGSGIVNASMHFDAERMEPTFRLTKGRPGRSYGLAIARRLGFPGEILDRAESYRDSGAARMEDVLERLEEQEQEVERLLHELDLERLRTDRLRTDVESREQTLVEAERTAEDRARTDARQLLMDARAEVESVIAELRAAAEAGRDLEEAARVAQIGRAHV